MSDPYIVLCLLASVVGLGFVLVRIGFAFWHQRDTPVPVRDYPCSQGCGARISANVLLFTGGSCLACEAVEYVFEQMRVTERR